jgi:hypothetical protein
MRDDVHIVSTREWRAVREGETHAATKTSTNNTPESFIVGIGASGAVLAGAAIVFVTLVGLVSFNVWPTSKDAMVDGNVELSAATKSAVNIASAAPAGAASVQAASTAGATGAATGNVTAGNTGGGQQGDSGGGGGNGGNNGPKPSPPTTAPTTPAPPGDTGSSDPGSSDGSSGSGSGPPVAGKDPAHPVQPTHGDRPHGNVSTGSKEPAGGDTDVTGKGPFTKPTHDSSSSSGYGSDSDGDSHGREHGSSRSRH